MDQRDRCACMTCSGIRIPSGYVCVCVGGWVSHPACAPRTTKTQYLILSISKSIVGRDFTTQRCKDSNSVMCSRRTEVVE